MSRLKLWVLKPYFILSISFFQLYVNCCKWCWNLVFPTAIFLNKLHVPWIINWNYCFVLGTPVFIHLDNQAETCFSVTYKNQAFHFWPLTFALAIQVCRPVIHKIQILNLSWVSNQQKSQTSQSIWLWWNQIWIFLLHY